VLKTFEPGLASQVASWARLGPAADTIAVTTSAVDASKAARNRRAARFRFWISGTAKLPTASLPGCRPYQGTGMHSLGPPESPAASAIMRG